MQRQFTRFVESPSRKNYLAVRDAVLKVTPLPMGAAELAEVAALLEAGAYQDVLDRIDLLPASKVLSPRIHYLAAEAADGLGDDRASELERFLFVLCLKGLLATGEGTQAAPYSICHVTDEHDLLEAGGHQPAAQSLVAHEGRWCDVVTCADGREVWFDVSVLFQRLLPKTRSRTRSLSARSAAHSAARKRPRPLAAAGRSTGTSR